MPAGKYRWTILMMVYICMLVFAFTLQVLPPVLPLIIKEFHLSHAGAGALMSVFTFPSIFLAVLAGSLSDRWGSYKVGLVSFLMTITGTLLFLSSRTFFIAATGRFVAGAGAVTLCIVAAKTISLWFKDHELGGAMGIYNTAMPVGTIICFTTFGRLGEKLVTLSPCLRYLMIPGSRYSTGLPSSSVSPPEAFLPIS